MQFSNEAKETAKNINHSFAIPVMQIVLNIVLSVIATFVIALGYLFANIDVFLSDPEITMENMEAFLFKLVSTDNLFGIIFQIIIYIPMLALPILIFKAVKKKKFKQLIGFGLPKPSILIMAVFICLGVSALSDYITFAIVDLLELIGFVPPELSIKAPSGIINILLFIFILTFPPAFFEEFAYRGAMIGTYKKNAPLAALIVSSFAFSLMHGTVWQIPGAFLLGIFMGYFVIKYDSIWIGVIIHFLNNLIASIFAILSNYPESDLINWIFSYINIVLIVFGIGFTIIYLTKEGKIFLKSEIGLSGKQQFITVLKTPGLYIFLAAAILLFVINNIEAFFKA